VLALLVPFGSLGDVHPSLAPRRAPRARGHQVTLLISGDFGPLVRRLGFEAPGTTSRLYVSVPIEILSPE
jgi:UDP:flavonoid glycosyltransferase YjiC (YdhE family)